MLKKISLATLAEYDWYDRRYWDLRLQTMAGVTKAGENRVNFEVDTLSQQAGDLE
ncbi:MAG: hypothetical protein HKP32_12895 [Woeseia sp.]|nr:hypothetical protein [Woeseia sp.]